MAAVAPQVHVLEGGCHCKGVRFRAVVRGPALDVYSCNCSLCTMKRNDHFVVPASDFQVTQGSELLTEYRFNTATARHLFCRVCGVQAFYRPRSNPNGYAPTVYCLDAWPELPLPVVWKKFDGQNWEQQIQTSDIVGKA